jgi:hypothetical protein
MNHRWNLGIFCAGLVVLATSCAQQAEGTFPVTGKVLFEGNPAAGAVVTFVWDGSAQPGREQINPSGVTDEDGTFRLSYGSKGLGAPAGKYIVLVTWRYENPSSKSTVASPPINTKVRKRVSRDEKRDRKLTPDVLKGRYCDISKPLLRAEVRPEPNNLAPFELKEWPAPTEEQKPRLPRGNVTEDNG